MSNHEYEWPEVFQTGLLTYGDSEDDKAAACGDGLMGWANCMVGAEIPAQFGKGMAAIGKLLDITPTPENLSAYGKRFLDGDSLEAQAQADEAEVA